MGRLFAGRRRIRIADFDRLPEFQPVTTIFSDDVNITERTNDATIQGVSVSATVASKTSAEREQEELQKRLAADEQQRRLAEAKAAEDQQRKDMEAKKAAEEKRLKEQEAEKALEAQKELDAQKALEAQKALRLNHRAKGKRGKKPTGQKPEQPKAREIRA
jgi:ribosomal protein L3